MYLTPANLIPYLLDRGRITAESVAGGDVVVLEAARRNRNFKVICKKSPGIFVKQARARESQAAITLEREADFYLHMQSGHGHAELACLLPRLLEFDRGNHVLMLELLSQAENFREHHRRLGRFPEQIGALLGKALAACHSGSGRLEIESRLSREVPWVLSAASAGPAMFERPSPGDIRLLEILQKTDSFEQRMRELHDEWHQETLIHGDIRWENCLLLPGEEGDLELRMADWELCDIGDPAWDIGSILQECLRTWIFSMPMPAAFDPERSIEESGCQVEEMHPMISALWRSYIEARAVTAQDANALLMRSVRFSAARMVQTAFEQLTGAQKVSNHVVAMAQVSLNILKDPEQGARELFGLLVTA